MSLFFGTILPWLLVGVGLWLFLQLVRQNGRILLRLEALEESVRRLASGGLPVGAAAPDFDLPDAAGARHPLSEYRGRQVLLVFFDPSCGFCLEMAPHLAALPATGEGRPVPVVVVTRGPDGSGEWVRRHGVRCPVLFDREGQTAGLYRTDGTPMGYLIDERGRIASPVAAGAEALLALARPRVAVPPVTHPPPARGKANKGLEHSRLNRGGLTAGTPAPAFTVPRLGGGQLSLEEYRGRRVLLVFSDPECDPCTRLAPHLEAVHRTRPDLRVVMVSRRDAEANRRKADALGLTFPIGLQRSGEVAREYAMFQMPSGYLIDERGVVARGVAIGADAVLALAADPPVRKGEETSRPEPV